MTHPEARSHWNNKTTIEIIYLTLVMQIAVQGFRILPFIHLIPFLTFRSVHARAISSFTQLHSICAFRSGSSDRITIQETETTRMTDDQSQGLK